MLPAVSTHCPLPPTPVELWYGSIMLCAFLLVAEAIFLFFVERRWWRALALAPLLGSIGAASVGRWEQAARPSFTFVCANFPGQTQSGWVTSTPDLVASLERWGTTTIVLGSLLLGIVLAVALLDHRRALLVVARQG